MRLRLLSVLLLLGSASPVWADTDTSTTTLTIAPSATAGTTITAADENDRSNDVTTWANSHVHTLPNTTNFGTGASGDKALCANAADATDACIKWNDTANMWTLDNPTPGTYNQVATISSTTGITPGAIVVADGTGALTAMSSGSNGQILKRGVSTAAFSGTKTLSFARTAAAGSGAQAVTGMGFKPNAVWISCGDNSGSDYISFGMGDSAAGEVMVGRDGNVPGEVDSTTNIISIGPVADVMTAVLTSIDVDGFTVTWTKNGAGRNVDCVALGI